MKKHLVVLATSIAGLLILIQFIHPAGTQALAVRTSPASFKPAAPSPVVANDGDLDPTFKATVIEDTDAISTVITQPDGKIIVGGFFESVGGCLNRTVARLNPDGSCDPSFEPDPAVPGPFNGQTTAAALALQSDGKILVGFRFFAPGSIVRKLVVRLNTDGSLDTSFNANLFNAAFSEAAVHDIAVQPDGRIIVGGIFNYNFNGAKRSLARLNADGSFDASFVPSFNGPMGQRTIFALGLQTDGRIIIGGQFTMFNTVGGEPRDAVARLNADGSLDTTFGRLNPDGSITSDLSGSAVSLVIQPNGQVIAAGGLTFTQDGSGLIMRLGTDGRRDPSFANIFLSGGPRTLALQPDGRVVAGGDFQITAPATRNNIARLNSDGTLDTSFDTGTGMTGTMRVVEGVALQANGQVAVGGGFDNFNGAFAEDILLLNSDGSRDATFESNGAGRSARVNALLRQPDCKLLVGFGGIAGFSTKLNGARMNGIGRLNPDSSVDTSFASPLTTAAIVFAMALQSDGKVIIGGNLNISPTSFKLLRLNADGSLDPTFNPPTDLNPRAIVIQPDGKIIAAGNYVARLNSDGSLDNTFARADFFGAGFPTATSLALQSDGSVVIAGIFAGVNSTSRNNIARLNPDGSVDTSFNPGAGPNSTVDRLVLQPDGRIIIGGNFFNYDSTARDRLARINADGSLDTSFVPVNPNSKRIGALLLQSDAKLLIGSLYDGSSKTPPSRVFRLNADGTLDLTFNLGTGLEEDFIAGGDVNAFSMQADGNLVIGGRFDVANDQPRLCLARLLNSTASPPSSQSTFQFSAAAYTVSEHGGTAIITVTRAGGSACDPVLMVDYATSDGTATGGINAPPILFDYAPASGTLTFLPGEISMTFNVTIYDDTSDESDETVNLMLSNPTGGATLGPQSAAVLTILDDDNAPAPGMTSVSLTSSSNPSVTGSPVTFTATVSVVPPATGTPTGTVEFFDGAASLGSAALVGGSAQLSTSTLTAGSHTINAVYGGAAGFTGSSSSPLVQVVGLATPVGLNVPITLPVGNTTLRVVFAEVIEAGVTTAYAIDRCQLPLPSSIFVDANSRAFEINTTARFTPQPPPILPGQPNPPPIAPASPSPPPIRLSFEMPFVTNQTAFNSLRMVHYFTPIGPPIVPPNPVAPQDDIVPPNPICPAGLPQPPPIIPQIQLATRDFATRTITANLT